jgi:glycosyltransferase involved in cell wall biosynthesis
MRNNNTQLHIVFTLANNSTAPYFNWFAERASRETHVNVKMTFVCLFPEKPKMIEEVGRFGWECHWIKYDYAHRKTGLLRALFEMTRLFRKIKPDVVNSHLFDDALPALLAARLAGVKIRANTRGDASYHYYYTPKWFVFDKFNNWNSTDIIAISEECKDFVLKYEKADNNKVVRIHHGIPMAEHTAQNEADKSFIKKKYGLEGKTIIGTVCRLIEWKGYRYIIEAAKDVVKSYPNSVFLFVGTGDQKAELEELVKEKGLENHIVFAGWVDRNMIPSLYGILHIYVHAASNEPFGFVIAEAMANAVPVVSTKTGAALDAITHLENGYLVEHKDSRGLAEGIKYILSNDTSKMRLLTKEAALRMYDFERMWDDYINVYLPTSKRSL